MSADMEYAQCDGVHGGACCQDPDCYLSATERVKSAAPELLDALQNILMHIGSGRSDDGEWVCEPIHIDEIKAARAAIQKATGSAA